MISILIFGALGDITTTLLCYWKAPLDNESSPIHFGNIYVTMALKALAYGLAALALTFWYKDISFTLLRYVFIYFIVLASMLQIGAMVSNIQYLQIPSHELRQATEEELKQGYSDFVYDLQGVKPKNIPILFFLFPLNVLQFIVWRSFESWRSLLIYNRDTYASLSYVRG